MPSPSDTAPEDARAARKRWEAEKVAAARREVAEGLYITGDELDRWLELSMRTDQPVPIPATVASRRAS